MRFLNDSRSWRGYPNGSVGISKFHDVTSTNNRDIIYYWYYISMFISIHRLSGKVSCTIYSLYDSIPTSYIFFGLIPIFFLITLNWSMGSMLNHITSKIPPLLQQIRMLTIKLPSLMFEAKWIWKIKPLKNCCFKKKRIDMTRNLFRFFFLKIMQ